jgi:hypothetical protein
MTQLQFSLDMEILKDSVMNSNIDNVIKSAVVLVLNEYMEKERKDYLHAAAYERSDERRDYRNGYYERELTMSKSLFHREMVMYMGCYEYKQALYQDGSVCVNDFTAKELREIVRKSIDSLNNRR